MLTIIYADVDGSIKETQVAGKAEADAFFKELAKKNIPMRKIDDGKVKMRVDEVEEMLKKNYEEFEKQLDVSPRLWELIEEKVKLEIEKHDLLSKKV